jgi:hypothetical protein
MWLASQSRNDIMPPELRPDRCGVIFTEDRNTNPDPDLFEVHPDRDDADALKRRAVVEFIDREQSYGRKAKLVTHYIGEEDV